MKGVTVVFDLAATRFYGAKSEPIDSVTVRAQVPVATADDKFDELCWQLLDVAHGGTRDCYQVLLNAALDADVLSTEAGASAYLAALSRFGTVHGTFNTDEPWRPLGAEQSNTSLVSPRHIVKVFRRLEQGLNPDVELLSKIGDNPHVAAVTGYVVRDGATLAMQQERIASGTDGFLLATGDAAFRPADSLALGEAIKSVHTALASAFATEHVSTRQLQEVLLQRFDAYTARADVLTRYRKSVAALYANLSGDDTVSLQRIHGDLHLGQTLCSPSGWYLIDFEGEPARPLEQRRQLDHPLRDVAGMVRSFGYAAAIGGFDAQWEQGHVEKLVQGYAGSTGVDRNILAAYVVDKAAYEVVYEANNRPDWVEIPLRALERLT